VTVDVNTPLPPPEQVRAEALGVLRSIALDPGADPAARQDAVDALRGAHDQLFALLETAGQLEPDAVAVLVALAKRLAVGRKAYGDLDVARDPRDFRIAAAEEALDLAAYLSMQLLRQQGTP
jgi:hypothetical protein